jgi:hypothetical protein
MSITTSTGRAPAQLPRILRRSVAVPVVALPVDAFATVTTEPPTTVAPGGDLPAAERSRSRTARPGRGSLGGRLARLVAVLVTMMAMALGGAAPASAETIGPGYEYVYLGWYWDHWWNGSQWVPWPVTMWSPPAGGGRLYCWWQTADCWWEQHPWRLP